MKSLFIFGLLFGSTLAQNFLVKLPDSIAAVNTPVVWEKKIPSYCEGPVWEMATSSVYFTEQKGGSNWPIWKFKPNITDTGSIFVPTRQSNGLEFDKQNRLVAAQDNRIARYKSDGNLDVVLIQSGANGVNFGKVNDLSIGSNGAIYFTDLASNVFFLNNSGQLSIASSGLGGPNGIEWIEERGIVFVNENGNSRMTRFTTSATNGSLLNSTPFATISGPDGGAMDIHGNHYVASYPDGEIKVFNAVGVSLGSIALKFATGIYDPAGGNRANTSNCAFGGPNNKTLYITGDGGLYSVVLKIPGREKPIVDPIFLRQKLKGLSLSDAMLVDVTGRKHIFPKSPFSRITTAPLLKFHAK